MSDSRGPYSGTKRRRHLRESTGAVDVELLPGAGERYDEAVMAAVNL